MSRRIEATDHAWNVLINDSGFDENARIEHIVDICKYHGIPFCACHEDDEGNMKLWFDGGSYLFVDTTGTPIEGMGKYAEPVQMKDFELINEMMVRDVANSVDNCEVLIFDDDEDCA